MKTNKIPQVNFNTEPLSEAVKNLEVAFVNLGSAFHKKIDKQSKFEKFYDFMSNFIFGGKRTVLALIILISLNVNAQEISVKNKFDLVVYDKVECVLKIKPDGTMIVSDSLKAIHCLYKELNKALKERDMLSKQIFDAIIDQNKKQKTISFPKKLKS